jgi:hypothetical protein
MGMAYHDAETLFTENLEMYQRAKPKPDSIDSLALYNLSKGLLELTQAIETDLREMKDRLARSG